MVAKKKGLEAKEKAEEERKWEEEERRENFSSKVKKALMGVIGALVLIGGVYLCIWQWEDLWPVLQGVAGPVVILVALFVLLLAWIE